MNETKVSFPYLDLDYLSFGKQPGGWVHVLQSTWFHTWLNEIFVQIRINVILTWKVSGGTVRANISNLDLSLNALAVEAGEIWGMRKSLKRLATYKKQRKKMRVGTFRYTSVSSYLNRHCRIGASYHSFYRTRSVELELRCATSVTTFIPEKWGKSDLLYLTYKHSKFK